MKVLANTWKQMSQYQYMLICYEQIEKAFYKGCLASFFLTFLMEKYIFGSTMKRTKADAYLLQRFDN